MTRRTPCSRACGDVELDRQQAHPTRGLTRGQRLVDRMRGRAITNSMTDELMKLLRED